MLHKALRRVVAGLRATELAVKVALASRALRKAGLGSVFYGEGLGFTV